MTTLYDLTSIYIRLAEAEDEDFEQALHDLEGDIGDKLSNITRLMREWDAEAAAIKTEEDRLKARRYTLEHKRESLKRYTLQCLQAAGLTKWRDTLFSISVMPPRKQVHVYEPDAVPEQFVKVERSVVKDALKRALEQGEEIPGAALVDGEPYLVLR